MQIMLQSKSGHATSRIMVALWLSTDPAVSATLVVLFVVVAAAAAAAADAVVVARWSIWKLAEVWNIYHYCYDGGYDKQKEKKNADSTICQCKSLLISAQSILLLQTQCSRELNPCRAAAAAPQLSSFLWSTLQ